MGALPAAPGAEEKEPAEEIERAEAGGLNFLM
jgi:hypothetical protein